MKSRLGWPDVLAVASVASIAYGLWLIYPPLTWIVAGVALALAAYLIGGSE